MRQIPFTKMTMLGNNFVLVDEIHSRILNESEKSSFAFHATNFYYGIGSDNFLVVQPCLPEILHEIQCERLYWDALPNVPSAEYIFRMFEPTGVEAFSCGNGLLCVAQYLYAVYGIEAARVITEIPTKSPKVITVGTTPSLQHKNWTSLGYPQRLTSMSGMVNLLAETDAFAHCTLHRITFDIPREWLPPQLNHETLSLSGHLVFTGEPHFVIFPEIDFSLPEVAANVFRNQDTHFHLPFESEHLQLEEISSLLVHSIGRCLNQLYAKNFPVGINIDFVRVVDREGILEYRCFERGIYRETLACGTGAVASAFVANTLNLCSVKTTAIWPHCCRWHTPTAVMSVNTIEQEWILSGSPVVLYDGVFQWDGNPQ